MELMGALPKVSWLRSLEGVIVLIVRGRSLSTVEFQKVYLAQREMQEKDGRDRILTPKPGPSFTPTPSLSALRLT